MQPGMQCGAACSAKSSLQQAPQAEIARSRGRSGPCVPAGPPPPACGRACSGRGGPPWRQPPPAGRGPEGGLLMRRHAAVQQGCSAPYSTRKNQCYSLFRSLGWLPGPVSCNNSGGRRPAGAPCAGLWACGAHVHVLARAAPLGCPMSARPPALPPQSCRWRRPPRSACPS